MVSRHNLEDSLDARCSIKKNVFLDMPTEIYWILLSLLAAVILIVIGFVLGWFLARLRHAKLQSHLSTEHALLQERLSIATSQQKQLQESSQQNAEQQRALEEEFRREMAKRAAAEQLNAQIPDLKEKIVLKDRLLEEAAQRESHLRSSFSQVETQLADERKANEERLATALKNAAEKLQILEEARAKLLDAFKALSSDALQLNSKAFFDLAKSHLDKVQETSKGELEKRHQAIEQVLKPVQESIQKMDGKIFELEKAREGAYAQLKEQVRNLQETQVALRDETSNLVQALRFPQVRGAWGEMQLKRVVELSGMLDHCDFFTQSTVRTSDGLLRPDLVVKLPGNKQVVVDAKVSLSAYLEGVEAQDDAQRQACLERHARQIRNHIHELSRKAYFEQFDPAPEFVVLFLPGEVFFSAALQQDPGLIEVGVGKNVILATPTTLIALLRAVAYGWRQENLAQSAMKISALGKALYKSLGAFGEHLTRMGKNLGLAVDSYNSAVGSLERNVLPKARRFEQYGVQTSQRVDELQPVEQTLRRPQAEELLVDATESEMDTLALADELSLSDEAENVELAAEDVEEVEPTTAKLQQINKDEAVKPLKENDEELSE